MRPAREEDVADIHRLVLELADYEKAPAKVEASAADLADALFAPTPRVHCHVADSGEGDLAGMALWYVTYSTWTGRHGIWLEDLYVRPRHRRRGLGRALLASLAAECARQEYRRLEWWVLDWNTPAREFYASLGAEPMSEWTVQRLDGDDLHAVAGLAAQERAVSSGQ